MRRVSCQATVQKLRVLLHKITVFEIDLTIDSYLTAFLE